jgi:hypothetical protein
MNILKEVVGVIGSIIVVYFGARIAATIGDFYQHFRTRRITQLSLWSDIEKLVKSCQDGEFPKEYAATIDLGKASTEDLNRLSKIKNPLKALERRLNLLFASSNVADKMEVRREKNLLHICSTSW